MIFKNREDARASENKLLQRLSRFLIFTAFIFTVSTLSANNTVTNLPTEQRYILYYKTPAVTTQDIKKYLAPELKDLPALQNELAIRYGLKLTEWLLLPDDNAYTRHYPAVTLNYIGKDEDILKFTLDRKLSHTQLLRLNHAVKSPAQLKDLRGQWVIVPTERPKSVSEVHNERASMLTQQAASLGKNIQMSGMNNALRSAASQHLNNILTAEVESWLNGKNSKARVTLDSGTSKQGRPSVGLDYLYPFAVWPSDILFTQLSAHRKNSRDIVNLGLGWRHNSTPQLMTGSNVFVDHDITRHHNRLGLGLELWTEQFRSSLNYYIPLSGWRSSSDTVFLDDSDYFSLYERPARGWDVNVITALSRHISVNASWFKWYGDKVDVTGNRDQSSKNPGGLTLGIRWQPVPLLSSLAEHRLITDQDDEIRIGIQLTWEFGRKFSELLDPANVTLSPSLLQSRNEFVTRNNDIVLAYQRRSKDTPLRFEPATMSAKAGSPPFTHTVQGAFGTVIYHSAQPELASVDATNGMVTPLRRGQTTIYATEHHQRTGKARRQTSYALTIQPGDALPGATDVTISGEMALENQLTGHYSYQDNNGEDEAVGGSVVSWYYEDAPDAILSSEKTYTISEHDAEKVLVFRVIPKNRAGITGQPVEARIQGLRRPTVQDVDIIGPVIVGQTVNAIWTGHRALDPTVNNGADIRWVTVNNAGDEKQVGEGATLTLTEEMRTQGALEVRVTPLSPGGLKGEEICSPRYTILPAEPFFSEMPSVSPAEGLSPGDLLTLNYGYGSHPEVSEGESRYSWFRVSPDGGNRQEIAGQTARTYRSVAEDAGYALTACVQLVDAKGTVSTTTECSAPSQPIGSLPVISNVDINGLKVVGQTVTASWQAARSDVQFQVRWYIVGNNGLEDVERLVGEQNSLTLTRDMKNRGGLEARVTPLTPGGIAGLEVRSPRYAIKQSEAYFVERPTLAPPDSLRPGTTVTVNWRYGSYLNIPEGNSRIEWYRVYKDEFGRPEKIEGETGRQYTLKTGDIDYRIFARVTLVDQQNTEGDVHSTGWSAITQSVWKLEPGGDTSADTDEHIEMYVRLTERDSNAGLIGQPVRLEYDQDAISVVTFPNHGSTDGDGYLYVHLYPKKAGSGQIKFSAGGAKTSWDYRFIPEVEFKVTILEREKDGVGIWYTWKARATKNGNVMPNLPICFETGVFPMGEGAGGVYRHYSGTTDSNGELTGKDWLKPLFGFSTVKVLKRKNDCVNEAWSSVDYTYMD